MLKTFKAYPKKRKSNEMCMYHTVKAIWQRCFGVISLQTPLRMPPRASGHFLMSCINDLFQIRPNTIFDHTGVQWSCFAFKSQNQIFPGEIP